MMYATTPANSAKRATITTDAASLGIWGSTDVSMISFLFAFRVESDFCVVKALHHPLKRYRLQPGLHPEVTISCNRARAASSFGLELGLGGLRRLRAQPGSDCSRAIREELELAILGGAPFTA
jgi:hypothetical protein